MLEPPKLPLLRPKPLLIAVLLLRLLLMLLGVGIPPVLRLGATSTLRGGAAVLAPLLPKPPRAT
jgi:hypothetical protein